MLFGSHPIPIPGINLITVQNHRYRHSLICFQRNCFGSQQISTLVWVRSLKVTTSIPGVRQGFSPFVPQNGLILPNLLTSILSRRKLFYGKGQ
jgi:hypothetical protein